MAAHADDPHGRMPIALLDYLLPGAKPILTAIHTIMAPTSLVTHTVTAVTVSCTHASHWWRSTLEAWHNICDFWVLPHPKLGRNQVSDASHHRRFCVACVVQADSALARPQAAARVSQATESKSHTVIQTLSVHRPPEVSKHEPDNWFSM